MAPRYSPEIDEVFRWFGIVAHNIQTLEADMINILLLVGRIYDQSVSIEQLKNHELIFLKKTMGQLLNKLTKDDFIKNDIPSIWEQARIKRNYIVHHFYYTNSTKLYTSKGCEELIKELKKDSKLFEMAISEARSMSNELYQKSIGDLDGLKRFMDKDLERMIKEEFN